MFTLEDVLRETRAVVIEKGSDYVYPESEKKLRSFGDDKVCQYSHDGNPSCLVGHVIHRLDPDAFQSVMENELRYGAAEAGELMTVNYLPEDFWDDEAEEAMSAAQLAQDKGATWGRALFEAESAVH